MQTILSEKAKRQFLRLLPAEKARVKKKLILLSNTPYIGKKLSGELKRFRSLRVWPYRIIYSINEKRVEIQTIIHRQGAYKG